MVKKSEVKSKKSVKVVAVRFKDTPYSVYHYKTDLSLKEGDACVVDTPSSGLTCVRVVSVMDTAKQATKWVVDKVDMSKHLARKEKEEKIKEVRAKMSEMRKSIDEMALLRAYASQSKEFAVLLKELEELQEE